MKLKLLKKLRTVYCFSSFADWYNYTKVRYLEEASRTTFVLIMGSREGLGLEQPNLLKAVDVWFKLFYILVIHYPWQCGMTWEFTQKVLFGIEDKNKGKTEGCIEMRV